MSKRLLVVDDDRDFRRIVERWIEESRPDVQVSFAASASDGVAAIRQSPPDMVLTDLRFHGVGTGEDVIRAAQTARVPVVAVSGVTRATPPGVEFVSKDDLRAQLPRLLANVWLTSRNVAK